MKKRILASLMALLCVITAGFSSCGLLPKTESVTPEGSGNENKNNQNVNTTIDGEETKDEVDGEDTSSKEEEKNVIKIASNGMKFTDESQEKITIRNVPATKKVIDESKLDVTYGYTKDGKEIRNKIYTTTNIEDVYSFVEGITKAEGYPYHGLLILPDTTGMNFFNTTYSFADPIEKDVNVPNCFSINGATLKGIIQMEDGREYDISLGVDSQCTYVYQGLTYPLYSENVMSKYISYEGNAFLTESKMGISRAPLYSGGIDTNSGRTLGIYYSTKNAENPYYIPAFAENDYYVLTMNLQIWDTEKYTKNGQLTDEELALVIGQIYDLIKDCFVVYDYEYYSQKINKGAIEK